MDMESTLDKEYPPKITLESLSQMTGFSKELIQEELLLSDKGIEEIGLEELRLVMASFLDRSMLFD